MGVFHLLAVWLYALHCLSEHISQYRARAIALACDVHHAFVLPGRGVIWKMKEDLSGPYPGVGYGALDHLMDTSCIGFLENKRSRPKSWK